MPIERQLSGVARGRVTTIVTELRTLLDDPNVIAFPKFKEFINVRVIEWKNIVERAPWWWGAELREDGTLSKSVS